MRANREKLMALTLLAVASTAMAAFSRFVVITPANEAKYPLLIQVEAVPGHERRSRIRVVGDVGSDQRAWLVVCRESVDPGGQYFRDVFWFDAKDANIERYIQLFSEQTRVPGRGDHLYPYVELELSHEQMRRAYIYIDYPYPVDDGGYYYSIDLAYYLESDLGKKSEIQWGGQQRD